MSSPPIEISQHPFGGEVQSSRNITVPRCPRCQHRLQDGLTCDCNRAPSARHQTEELVVKIDRLEAEKRQMQTTIDELQGKLQRVYANLHGLLTEMEK